MRTVQNLIEALKQFPAEAKCYGYEGELCGIVVVDGAKTIDRELGYIDCGECGCDEDREPVVFTKKEG